MESAEAMATVIRWSRVSGDLHIKNWENAPADATVRLMVDGEARDPSAVETIADDAILLLAVPVTLTIDRVDGDVTIRGIRGDITIATVAGDTYCEGVRGAVTLRRVEGDLVILNHTGQLRADAVQGDTIVDSADGSVTLGNTSGDVTIRTAAAIVAGQIQGDLRVQHTESLTVTDLVAGDVTISDLLQCVLGSVRGDATIVDVTETMQCARVDGDLWLRDLRAAANIASVGGNLVAQNLTNGLTAHGTGDAFLESALTVGCVYDLEAAEIILRVKSPISAQFVAQSVSGEVRTHLPLAIDRHRRNLVGVIGKGEATVTLHSQGDIVVDGAGARTEETTENREQRFHFHIPNGPEIDIDLSGLDQIATMWPFRERTHMTTPEPNDQEFEQRIRDLGERSGRAARKAAEKIREVTDRAAARARETDWDAVSREFRSIIERVVSELDTTVREVVKEFQAPGTPGEQTTKARSGATSQRIPVDREDAVDGSATMMDSTPGADMGSAPTMVERDARRRAILEQLRAGDLTLDEAESRLREL